MTQAGADVLGRKDFAAPAAECDRAIDATHSAAAFSRWAPASATRLAIRAAFFDSGNHTSSHERNEGSPTFDLQGYYFEFAINFNASGVDDWITLTMDPAEGFALGSNTLAAVPEPSTYALLFGLSGLGYAAYRRRRAA